jgi:pimeloyl-ACP methyl ester carboxylesterase
MEASASAESASAEGVRPFTIDIPDEQIKDLRTRIEATRWPGKEIVADATQGVQLDTTQELIRYWGSDYDMSRLEDRLNAFPQSVTEIDGVDIHFIHVRSRHENALPLIISHGWPGSVIELLEVVGPLTDPTAYGESADDAFDLVLPSLPGYGFSEQPASVGWDPGRVARALAELMNRLGYTRYVAQGGDVGAAVTDTMAIQAPDGLAGIHLNFLRRPPLEVGGGDLRRRASARGAHRGGTSGVRPVPSAVHEGLHRRTGPVPADDRLLPDGLARRSGSLDARPRHR